MDKFKKELNEIRRKRIRATYSKDYKKGYELKKIRETCAIEDRRCIIILQELVKKKIAYATTLDETSRLNDLIIQFKKEVNIK